MIVNLRLIILVASLVTSWPALATPKVAASIKPLHSMVAAVMQGVGKPELIVRSTGSEHAYALRPSDAAALDGADLVFWMGPGMESFLETPLRTLAGDATVVALGAAPGVATLPLREGGAFETHDHVDQADAGDTHDHDHEEHDLHVWLDPGNGKAMVAEIVRALAAADPKNADRYTANAEAYSAKLDDLASEIASELAPMRGRAYIVFHDAYQYFERRFEIPAAGSITVSPEVMPGAARVAAIRAKVAELGAACVFSEPQFESAIVDVVIEGTSARTGILDPLGSSLPDGPDLYPRLIRNLADALKDCLAKAG